MTQFLLFALLLVSLVKADNISAIKYAKLVQKGEKVALKLCDEKKLQQVNDLNLPAIYQSIEKLSPCITLNKRNKEALAYYILARQNTKEKITHTQAIDVPKEVKCPVCGMFVAKYPKWAAYIEEDNHQHYFDGVKDMMKFYIFDVDFPYDRSKIQSVRVTDFYTLHAIDAKKSFYVIGSDVFGPMGNEFIPFLTKEAAENFMLDHNGKKIITFEEITPQLVMSLDGIEYSE